MRCNGRSEGLWRAVECGDQTPHAGHYFNVPAVPVSDTFVQKAVDLAPLLRYTADLAAEGESFVPYVAMLASIKGDLVRLFEEEMPDSINLHTVNPKESS